MKTRGSRILSQTASVLLTVSFTISPLTAFAQSSSKSASKSASQPSTTSSGTDTLASSNTSSAQSPDATPSSTAVPSASGTAAPAASPSGGGGIGPLVSQPVDPIFGPQREATKSTLHLEPDQIDGSLKYAYPLMLPPGRNGMAPQLSLVYSSSNTEQISQFGYGWSLNIPYIQRMNKAGTDQMYSRNDYYSTLDGDLAATSTGGGMMMVEAGTPPTSSSSPPPPITSTTTASTSSIQSLLNGKTFQEKENIKADAIINDGLSGVFYNSTYNETIQIVSAEKIDNGIQVYAKAWNGNQQLGFGADGSVEIERFRIFNPPILVPDGTKHTVTDVVGSSTITMLIDNFREDPIEAAHQVLAHAAQTSGKLGTTIVPGKVGRTTDVFYGNPAEDGDVGSNPNSAENWSTIRSDAGNEVTSNAAARVMTYIYSPVGSGDSWQDLHRAIFMFDTSALPDGDTITAATLSLYGAGEGNALSLSPAPDANVYSVTTGSDTSLSASDYNIANWGSTAYTATPIGYSGWSSSGYNNFAFNATGIAAINAAGRTKLGVRNANYDVANTAPTHSVSGDAYLSVNYADQTGTSEDPELTVTHGSVSSSGTSCPTGVNEVGYGALVDNGNFNTYKYWDSCYWTVTDKNGTIYTFGASSTAQIVNPNNASSTYRWYLQSARDRNDNYISYTYTKDNGQVYPSKITYTGHGSTDGIYEIDFPLEGRNDIASSSVAGFPVVSDELVSAVQVKVRGTVKHTYTLGYGSGDDGQRSLLTSITEAGVDDLGATTTLPAVTFGYTTKTPKWTENTSWVMPTPFVGNNSGTDADWGARFDDINGDGLTDVVWYRSGDATSDKVFLNNNNGTWATTTPTGITNFVNSSGEDLGPRLSEVNGDGPADFIPNTGNVGINTGRGSSFATSSNWSLPVAVSATSSPYFDFGTRIVDINGDGLPDILHAYATTSAYSAQNGVYLNNGTGWSSSSSTIWTLPTGVFFAGYSTTTGDGTDQGVRFGDFNGDGLTDIIQSKEGVSPSITIYLNNGDGTWTSIVPTGVTASFVSPTGQDYGWRIVDANADGLADIVDTDHSGGGIVYLNQGAGKSFNAAWSGGLPGFTSSGSDTGNRFVDINGDGIPDIIRSYNGTNPAWVINEAMIGNGVVPDHLSTVSNGAGGSTSVVYKGSPQYTGTNPRLPMVMQTVSAIGTSNGFGTVGTTTYTYGGGEYYYSDAFNRKFASFATTTITDPLGNVTDIYSHQGNASDSTLGEYNDSEAKIGKPYRTEIYNSSGGLMTKQIDQWDSADLGNGRTFVKRIRSTALGYDGNSDHRDRSTTYGYNDSNGNLSSQIDYGEVSANDDGTFSDTGTDKRTTTYAYATSTAYSILGLPMSTVVADNSGTQASKTNFYYDNLSGGSVTIGNLTKTENWISGSSYASSTKGYNIYGLVASSSDPLGNMTTYTYESANMYIGTTTDPLGHVTETYRNMYTGKTTKTVDPNGHPFESVFDGLGRVVTEKIPDHLGTPTNEVTKTTYAYTDTTGARSILQTDYLNSATSTATYTYLDGFMRPIQTRQQDELTNEYDVKDTQYDARGDVVTESLPYMSGGSNRTAMTGNTNLLITHAYDALERATSTTNVEGTESYAYDQWKETITDRNSKTKGLTSDAFGNLVQVDEHNATSTYTTTYAYDALNNLTKITDALSNIRDFTYDGLSRLLTAQDLHASGDGTFGTRYFAYDLASNIASTTDAKSQNVVYTYDANNRVLTEDNLGTAGTEVSYGYDTCTNGKGHLCAATTTAATTNLAYDALGNVNSESRTIDGSTYKTTYTYDRLGNLTDMVYPNSREVFYHYNPAGQVESVLTRPSGGAWSALVNNLDYAPTRQISYKSYGNSVESVYTYDPNDLYRLKTILTDPRSGGGVGGNLSFGNGLKRAPSGNLAVFGDSIVDFLLNATSGSSTTNQPSVAIPDSSTASSATDQVNVPILTIPENSTSSTSTTLPSVPTTTPFAPPSQSTPSSTPITVDSSSTILSVPISVSTSTPLTADIATSTATSTVQSGVATSTDLPPFGIEADIAGLSPLEQATKKGQIIAAIGPIDKQLIGNYYIQIVSMEPMEGGVTVFVKAWDKSGNPIGFGTDGTVEIERIKVYNPYVEVPDYSTTRQQYDAAFKQWITLPGAKDDPQGAILMNIGQTVSVLQNKHDGSNIVSGKIGHTVSTFQPDSTDGLDNCIAQFYDGSSWVDTSTDCDGASMYAGDASSANSHYRSLLKFSGVSTIPSNAGITAVTLVLNESSDDITTNVNFRKLLKPWVAGQQTWLNYSTGNAWNSAGASSDGNDRIAATSTGYVADNASGEEIDLTGPTIANDVISWVTGTSTNDGWLISAEAAENTGGAPGTAVGLYTSNYGTASLRPKLVVQYITPASGGGAGSYQNLNYTYDHVGNITNLTDYSNTTGKIVDYTYDDLYRLTQASSTIASTTPTYTQTYVYNALGDITTKSDIGTYLYAGTGYANPHAPTSVNGTTYSYDNNGNLTGFGTTTYAWDYRDRITQSSNGHATSTYGYDQNNQRVWQKTSSSATTTYPNMYYSSLAGASTTAYIYLPPTAGGDLVAYIETGTTTSDTFYVHPDNLGSTNVVTDKNGNESQIQDYYPYGSSRIASSTPATAISKRYVGQYFDSVSSLNYLNARYESPLNGQFLSEDPVFWSPQQNLQAPQALNSYSYAVDNPITVKDPLGKASLPISYGLGYSLGFESGPGDLLVGTIIGTLIFGASSAYDAYSNHADGAPGSRVLQESMVQNAYSSEFQMGGPIGKPPGRWGPMITTAIGTGLTAYGGCLLLNCDLDWGTQAGAQPKVPGAPQPVILTPVNTSSSISWNNVTSSGASTLKKSTNSQTSYLSQTQSRTTSAPSSAGGGSSYSSQYISVLQQAVSVLQAIIRSYGATPVR